MELHSVQQLDEREPRSGRERQIYKVDYNIPLSGQPFSSVLATSELPLGSLDITQGACVDAFLPA